MHHRSVLPMKTAKIGYILVSAAFCVLGILFIVLPEMSTSVIGVIMAVTMILFGCIKLVGYFSKDLYRLAFQHDLAFGLLLVLLGIIALCKLYDIATFICALIGMTVITDALFKLQIAVDAKVFGIKNWWLILLTAICTGTVGIMLLLNPGMSSSVLMTLLGISLLCEGALNLITVLMAVKIIRYQKPDFMDYKNFQELESETK